MYPVAPTRPATSLPHRGNFLGVFVPPKSGLAKAYPRRGGSVSYQLDLRPPPASPEALPSATTSRLTRSSSLYPTRPLPAVRRVLPPRPALSASPRPSPPLPPPDLLQTETPSATIPLSPAPTPTPDGDSDSDVARALIGHSASGTLTAHVVPPVVEEEEPEKVVEPAAVEDAPGGEEAVSTEDDARDAPPAGAAEEQKNAARPPSAPSPTRAASSTSTPPSPHTSEPSPELFGEEVVPPLVVKLSRGGRRTSTVAEQTASSPRSKRVRKSTQAMVESIAQRDLDDDDAILVPKAEPEDDRPARALKRARRDPEEHGREVARGRGTERTREMSTRGSSLAPTEVLDLSLGLPEPVVKPRAPRDPNGGKTCHHDKNRSKTPKMSCITPDCTLLWCQRCVNKHYNGPTDPPFVAEGKFLCPVCRGACRCAFHRHKRGSGSLAGANSTPRKKRPREDPLDEIDAENETLVKRGKRRALDVDIGPDNFRDSLLALQREAVVLPGSTGEVSDTSGDEYEYEYGDEYGDEGEEESGDESAGDGRRTPGTSVTFSEGRSPSASGPRLFREDDPTPSGSKGLCGGEERRLMATRFWRTTRKEFAILANVLDPDLFPPIPPKPTTESSSLPPPEDSTSASPAVEPPIPEAAPLPTHPAGLILAPQPVAVTVAVDVVAPPEPSQPTPTPPVAPPVVDAPPPPVPLPPTITVPAAQPPPPLFLPRPFPPTPNYSSHGADVWAPTHVPTSAVPLSPPSGSPPRNFLPHRFSPSFSPRHTPHAQTVPNQFTRRPNSFGGPPPPGGVHAMPYRPPPVPQPSYVPSHYASSTPPTIYSHSRPQTTTPMMLVPAGADLEQHRFGPHSMYSHKDLDLLTNEELGVAVRQVLNSGPDFYAAASMAFSTVISHRHSSTSSSMSSIPVPSHHTYFANDHLGRRSPAPTQSIYAHHRYGGAAAGVGDESSFLADQSLLSEYGGTPFRHGSVGLDAPFADAGRSVGGTGGAASPSAVGGIPAGQHAMEGTTEDPWKATMSGGEGAAVGVGPSWSSVGWGE